MEAEPKSASFIWPGSVSKMFPALMSLSKVKETTALHKRQSTKINGLYIIDSI